MKLPVVWLPDAYAEFAEALAYYEAIRSELAERFATAVEETVGAIAAAPSRFAVVDSTDSLTDYFFSWKILAL